MDLNEFVKNFAEQFDETDASEIQASTVFHELDEWSSLTAMSIIAFAKVDFSKKITSSELNDCVTVEDVYNLLSK